MFADSEAFSTFAVDDVDQARKFYTDTLGLTATDEMGGLRLKIAGSRDIFIYPKPDFVPATYTVLNFPVEDIEKAVDALTERGVSFARYDGFDRDDKAILRSDQGPSAIAWFSDPAGNILAVMQA